MSIFSAYEKLYTADGGTFTIVTGLRSWTQRNKVNAISTSVDADHPETTTAMCITVGVVRVIPARIVTRRCIRFAKRIGWIATQAQSVRLYTNSRQLLKYTATYCSVGP